MKQDEANVIIVGAGAAGLMAAKTLAQANKDVLVLEARNRCGGRIHTINKGPFFKQAELGAEFIHGDLPLTLNLLNEAGIAYYPAGGAMLHFKEGTFTREDALSKYWDLLIEKLSALKFDMSITEFLQREFPGEKYNDLRNAVIQFASGYDTADPALASSFALRQEWQNEDEGTQHRPEGGYASLINYLKTTSADAGCRIFLNTTVKKIQYQKDSVSVHSDNGNMYRAKKVILALPLGVLQSEGKISSIVFEPLIPERVMALKSMGFGAVIKVLLQFKNAFWNDPDEFNLNNTGFILSEEAIPTWWTQAPQPGNLLTGWLGGLPAIEQAGASDEYLLELSLQSLSAIFDINTKELRGQLIAYQIINWTEDPFTLGSYAYDTVNASAHRKLLSKPVAGTIYFAGEYLYEGPAMGTVEAALTSGQQVARRIITSS